MNAEPQGVAGAWSRRTFLVGSLGLAAGASVPALRSWARSSSGTLNAWVSIDADGTVTIMSPGSEMGQGTRTAVPLMLAEEMDLDWARVRVVQAPANPRLYGNPGFGGAMLTGASRTTQGYHSPLRLAGVQARLLLQHAAAAHWGVPATDVRADIHAIVHQSSGRRLGYGDIVGLPTMQRPLPTVDASMLKPASAFRLIGKDIPRIDIASKTDGSARFGIDVRLPGMAYALLLRPPVQGEAALEVDDREALASTGVLKVVTVPSGVAIIATSLMAARKARALLAVRWSQSAPARRYSSDAVRLAYAERARDLASSGVDFVRHGDASGALAKASKVLDATYTSEHLAHVCMEPMNGTALVQGERIEIWVPSQSPARCAVALTAAGFKPENWTIHITLLGGGFGRRGEADFPLEVAQVAKALPGTPVKVIWDREDDIRFDKFRPLTAQYLQAGVDDKGMLLALRHRIVAESVYRRASPALFEQTAGKDGVVNEGSEIKYAVNDHWVEYLREQRGVDVGFWRGVGVGYTKFAIETLIDEIAASYSIDPLQYRLRMLQNEQRAQAVLRAVAADARWGRALRAGRALGIAYSDAWNTHIAMVVEVSIEATSRAIRVHEVWAAVDCGIAIQPRNVQAQVEGAVAYGLSAALRERITIQNGRVEQSNLHDYPVLRANEMPLVSTRVVASDQPPGGAGEIGLPPLAPAMANAIAVLTGQRLRSLPLSLAA
jgi:isoquinoline 1-oxidoreductase beta subunit